MPVSDLVTVVQARIAGPLLIQLTNDSPTATTVNATRLTAACEDAIGAFASLSGCNYDTTIYTHNSILIAGVIYYLETYKGREGALQSTHSKAFYSGCKSLRENMVLSPQSTSLLSPSKERAGSRPEMDKSRRVFSNTQRINSPATSTFLEDS